MLSVSVSGDTNVNVCNAVREVNVTEGYVRVANRGGWESVPEPGMVNVTVTGGLAVNEMPVSTQIVWKSENTVALEHL
jgi:hypothetical protein